MNRRLGVSNNDLLGYDDKHVVITGAASGMGEAAAQLLVDLGAQVYALDIADVSIPVAKSLRVDMKDSASIDAALAELPIEVHALFNCAGVPSPPFGPIDTMLINFSGLRYLTEALLPRMRKGAAIASIASTAGMGWKVNLPLVEKFLGLGNDLEIASEWMIEHADLVPDGYSFSKQCIIVYTMIKAGELAEKGIRINCIAPSPTDSGFMKKLKGEGGIPEEAVQLFLPSNGRYATGAEMGKPLVFLNSALASFISGVNLPLDFGYCAEVYTGQRDDLLGIA
jgi:NAD(P)-dependent dehydrogenase (short-subunit alcohol dehydrogenase family)